MQRSSYRRDNKESEDIHISGIDVGGGWRTGCGSHTSSAERVEEMEESVWSVVRQENEREHQGEGVQNSNNNNGRNGSCLTWLATSLEEKRRWHIINASPRGQCSK